MKKTYAIFLVAVGIIVLPFSATPQSPGGIETPVLWLKTEPVTPGNQNGNYRWVDYGPDGSTVRIYNSSGPTSGTEYSVARSNVRTYNFHPALNFSATTATKNFLVNNSNISQGTIFTVWIPSGNFSSDAFMFSVNGRPGEGFIVSKDFIVASRESEKEPLDYGSEEGRDFVFKAGISPESNLVKFQEQSIRNLSFSVANMPDHSFWGENNTSVVSLGGNYVPGEVNYNSTFDSSQFNNVQFAGYAAEFIIYDRILLPDERLKVESYLAMKYGYHPDQIYINAKDRVLWDFEANPSYNNRIVSIGREDASSLNTLSGTTSYEETPYYSYAYDSYQQADSYGLPSQYRLLAIGREKATGFNDDEFVVWGDNSASLNVRTITNLNGIEVMPRTWLLKSDLAYTNTPAWELPFTQNSIYTYTYNFETKIIKYNNDTDNYGTLISDRPITGYDGYMGFDLTAIIPQMWVKFGTSNATVTASSNDYGYYIDLAGRIYKITGGTTASTYFETLLPGQKLDFFKDKDVVGIAIDGIRLDANNIPITAANRDADYYPAMRITKNTAVNINLLNFRHGGLTDMGSYAELSYFTQRATDFSGYNGRSYLMVSRDGDFSSSATNFIPVTETDNSRYKQIFRNIFWNSPGNDLYLSFGRRENSLAYYVETTCATLNNGTALVSIVNGIPGFTLGLKKDTDIGYSHAVVYDFEPYLYMGLSAGQYDLRVVEFNGYHIKTKNTGTYLNNTIAPFDTNTQYLKWTVSNINQTCNVGLLTSSGVVDNPDVISTDYGVRIVDRELFLLKKGNWSEVPYATLEISDDIIIKREDNEIVIYQNERIKVGSIPIDSEDLTNRFYATFFVESEKGEFQNVVFDDNYSPINWLQTDNVSIVKGTGQTLNYQFTINACN